MNGLDASIVGVARRHQLDSLVMDKDLAGIGLDDPGHALDER